MTVCYGIRRASFVIICRPTVINSGCNYLDCYIACNALDVCINYGAYNNIVHTTYSKGHHLLYEYNVLLLLLLFIQSMKNTTVRSIF